MSDDIANLPTGWVRPRLDDVCGVAGTRSPKKEPEKPFRYVEISGIDNTEKRIVEVRLMLGKQAPSRARQVIREKDVLVATTRPNLNAVALVPAELDGEICSTGFCVLRAESIDSLYLFCFVQSEQFIKALVQYGGLYPAVTDDQVRAVRVAMPESQNAQRALAVKCLEELSRVSRARAAAGAQVEAATALTGAILREVFENDEAKVWPERELGRTWDVKLGKMLSPASKTGTRPLPYLRNANVQWGRFDLRDVACMDFTEEQERKLSLKPGDVLVCEGGEPGRAAVWNGEITPCCYQKALHRLRPFDGGDPDFIMYRLWHGALQREFVGSHAKNTIAHLPADRLKKLLIRVPSSTVQSEVAARIGAQMERVRRMTAAADQQLRTIHAMPTAILREIFGSFTPPQN